MTTKRLWLVPAAFLLVASVLDLVSCLASMRALEIVVKPTLLPLIALTSLAFLAGRTFNPRMALLLVAGQLFGMTGDALLIGSGFPFFAGGMGAFLLGHICYINLFGGVSWKGLGWKTWAIALPVMGCLLFGLVKVIGISGTLLVPMLVYGFALMLLIFSGLCGLLKDGAVWWLVVCGGALFLFSDGLIALRTFGLESTPWLGFWIMSTYIIAQCLLAAGGIALACKKAQ